MLGKGKAFDDSPVVELADAVVTSAVELAVFFVNGCSLSSSRGILGISRVPSPSRSDRTGTKSSIVGNARLLLSLLFRFLLGENFDIATGDDHEEISKRRFGGDDIPSPDTSESFLQIAQSSLVAAVSTVAKECVGDTAAAAEVHMGWTGRDSAYGLRW